MRLRKADTYVHTQRMSELHKWDMLCNTRTSTASTSLNLHKYTVFNSILGNFQKTSDHFHNVWMDYRNNFYRHCYHQSMIL